MCSSGASWERFGTGDARGVTLALRVTHLDLADMVGADRESVTAAVGPLQRWGEIEVRQRMVSIRQMDDQSLTATEIA